MPVNTPAGKIEGTRARAAPSEFVLGRVEKNENPENPEV